jgi:hypothetical protein
MSRKIAGVIEVPRKQTQTTVKPANHSILPARLRFLESPSNSENPTNLSTLPRIGLKNHGRSRQTRYVIRSQVNTPLNIQN